MKHRRNWDVQIKSSTKKSRKVVNNNLAAKERIKQNYREEQYTKESFAAENFAKPAEIKSRPGSIRDSFTKPNEDQNADLGNASINEREGVVSFEGNRTAAKHFNTKHKSDKWKCEVLTDSVHNRLLNLENRVGNWKN